MQTRLHGLARDDSREAQPGNDDGKKAGLNMVKPYDGQAMQGPDRMHNACGGCVVVVWLCGGLHSR